MPSRVTTSRRIGRSEEKRSPSVTVIAGGLVSSCGRSDGVEWVGLFVVTGEAWAPRVLSWSGNDLDTKRVALGSTWRLTPAVCCRNAAAAAFPKGAYCGYAARLTDIDIANTEIILATLLYITSLYNFKRSNT